uniref:Nuclear VCP like n=1 Tax=Prolemur simus TaxID=1328070 RepID=A0A8C8YAB6_PROSS
MKPRPAGFVDNKLKQRVIQYLASNRCGKYVDIGVLASDLQRMYSVDYGRRKRNAFRIQVEKVFSIISIEKEFKNLTELEDEHVAKRARQGEEDNEYAESYTDDDSDVEDYPDPQSANHMNSSLLSLYRKGNPDSVSNTPEMTQKETITSTPQLTSKAGSVSVKTPARDAGGGWFIDKSPGGRKDSFSLDLSCDKSNHKKPITEIQDSKDSSLLESDKTRKGRLRHKGSKRKPEDLQEVDGEIEAVLQKKGSLQVAHTHAPPGGVPPPGGRAPSGGSPSRAPRLWEDVTCTCDCWGEAANTCLFLLFLMLIFVCFYFFSLVNLNQTWRL